MANGNRGSRSSSRADETRIAPLEDEDVTDPRRVLSNATRVAPLEEADVTDPRRVLSNATRVASVEDEDPSAPGGVQRTMFASHAALLADGLRDKLSKKIYGRAPHRVLRIDEPEGPSTAGGRQARQSISLIPRRGSGPSIVCGWVDVSRKEAQLRSHESVARRFELHHGARMDLPAEDYERFLEDVEEALLTVGLKVRVLVPEEPAPSTRASVEEQQAPRSTGVAGWLVGVLVAAAFGLGLLVGRVGG